MFIHLLIVAFGIAAVLGQGSYGSESFKYWGCATVDAAGFDGPVQLPNGILSPESCQAACTGHMFAAVSPDACRCGDDPDAIKAVDEHSCNYPCSEDPNSQMCGGICPKGTPSISNLFIIEPEPGNPEDQSVSSLLPPVSPQQSAASDALPHRTSLMPSTTSLSEGEIPQPSTNVMQSPTDGPAPPPSAVPSPINPPLTMPNGPEDTAPESAINFPSTLTLSQDPLTPAAEIPDTSWEVPGIPPESRTKPTGSETLVTETSSEPTPPGTPIPVGVSESSQRGVPVLAILGKLLFIAIMIV
ncbi:hypothetical protein F66182_1228 [Fusarium sp. NRRL 66182]|nr:hypothetical protein F66182_1228 [Fusarium sp. NRRL 66182]